MKDGLKHVKKFLNTHRPNYQKLRVIHIAGTNGKGSTTQMIRAGLETTGHRVGTFISPHLLNVRERVMCDGEMISEPDFDRLLGVVFQKSDHSFSFFEMIVLVSVMYFLEQQVDYAVYEVGLGGTYDATNVRDHPVATVITSIGYDHQHILGSSLSQIQRNKMGIMKRNIPCFTRIDTPLMHRGAKCKGAELRIVSDTVLTNLHGLFQQENAGLARAVLSYLGCDDESIKYGLQHVNHLGRCQYLRPNVLLDSAHNEQGRKVLNDYIDTIRGTYDTIAIIFGTTKDAEYLQMWKDTLVLGDTIYLVKPSIDRGVDPALYKDIFVESTIVDLGDIVGLVNKKNEPKSTLRVIYGSLYLSADVLGMDW